MKRFYDKDDISQDYNWMTRYINYRQNILIIDKIYINHRQIILIIDKIPADLLQNMTLGRDMITNDRLTDHPNVKCQCDSEITF